MIHVEDDIPQYSSPARKLIKSPLTLTPDDPRLKTNANASINFGQVYTILKNMNVKRVGKIVERDLGRLEAYSISTICRTKWQYEPEQEKEPIGGEQTGKSDYSSNKDGGFLLNEDEDSISNE